MNLELLVSIGATLNGGGSTYGFAVGILHDGAIDGDVEFPIFSVAFYIHFIDLPAVDSGFFNFGDALTACSALDGLTNHRRHFAEVQRFEPALRHTENSAVSFVGI